MHPPIARARRSRPAEVSAPVYRAKRRPVIVMRRATCAEVAAGGGAGARDRSQRRRRPPVRGGRCRRRCRRFTSRSRPFPQPRCAEVAAGGGAGAQAAVRRAGGHPRARRSLPAEVPALPVSELRHDARLVRGGRCRRRCRRARSRWARGARRRVRGGRCRRRCRRTDENLGRVIARVRAEVLAGGGVGAGRCRWVCFMGARAPTRAEALAGGGTGAAVPRSFGVRGTCASARRSSPAEALALPGDHAPAGGGAGAPGHCVPPEGPPHRRPRRRATNEPCRRRRRRTEQHGACRRRRRRAERKSVRGHVPAGGRVGACPPGAGSCSRRRSRGHVPASGGAGAASRLLRGSWPRYRGHVPAGGRVGAHIGSDHVPAGGRVGACGCGASQPAVASAQT